MSRPRTRVPIVWSIRTGRAFRHGIPSGYSHNGCGCDPCYEAWIASPGYQREQAVSRAAADKRATS